MRYFDSDIGRIAFSDERKQHIFIFHPDVIPYAGRFAETLLYPDDKKSSANDSSVIIYYRAVPRRRVYFAIVVKKGPRPFILTAYLARMPKKRNI